MAISLNRCLHLRWVQTLKFYFCNYMCSTFSHIFMSGLGCLQYLWILPLFCRCTLLYFLVFKLFPNFLASLCSCIFFVLFWSSLWACFTSCHFFCPTDSIHLPPYFIPCLFGILSSHFSVVGLSALLFLFGFCLQGTFLVAVGFCFSSVVQGALSNQLWTALVASS